MTKGRERAETVVADDKIMVAEALSVMIEQERSFYRCHDYLRVNESSDRKHNAVTYDDRTQVVDWCFSFVDTLSLQRETVAIAMGLLDRFLSISSAASEALDDHREFQLLAIGALYIAIKTNERVAVHGNFFASLSRGGYSVEDIEDAEVLILTGLSWRLNGPTSLQVATHFLSLIHEQVSIVEDTWCFLLDEVQYQTELAVRDYALAIQRRSTIALAAIFNAMERLTRDDRLELFTAISSIIDKFSIASPIDICATRSRLHVTNAMALAINGNPTLDDASRSSGQAFDVF
ncbi:hypothetical protein HJC23_010650 [Cyclotella cryptica]|uniref:Cyclin-like domain-containing protein n=1 Tax=Cyclotella cryptica TaxID=29204 RepID=A0ABD3PFH0_9STRA